MDCCICQETAPDELVAFLTATPMHPSHHRLLSRVCLSAATLRNATKAALPLCKAQPSSIQSKYVNGSYSGRGGLS